VEEDLLLCESCFFGHGHGHVYGAARIRGQSLELSADGSILFVAPVAPLGRRHSRRNDALMCCDAAHARQRDAVSSAASSRRALRRAGGGDARSARLDDFGLQRFSFPYKTAASRDSRAVTARLVCRVESADRSFTRAQCSARRVPVAVFPTPNGSVRLGPREPSDTVFNGCLD
jgi:hypothetical protein